MAVDAGVPLHEAALYEARLSPPATLSLDTHEMHEWMLNARPFIERLSWIKQRERVHPAFPKRIQERFFERTIASRLQRAARRFGGRAGAWLTSAGRYRWTALLESLSEAEIASTYANLVPVLRELDTANEIRPISFESWLDHRCRGLVSAVNTLSGAARTVVFVTSRMDYKPLREAMALGPLGWHCFLVCLEPIPALVRPVFERAFQQILSLPLEPAVLQGLVRMLQPDVFHVHCAMWHYFLGRIVIDNQGNAVCACEFNDITSFYAPKKVMTDYWDADMVELDLAMEAYVCRRADLVLHQWHKGIEPHWKAAHGEFQDVMEMQPYPVTAWVRRAEDKPSRHDGVARMVWAGQIPGRIACPPVVFDAYYVGEAFEKLLEQGFAIDAYQNPMFTMNFADLNFEFYRKLAERFSRFTIRPGVRIDKLSETLKLYDFGLILFDIDFQASSATWQKNKYMLTNKLSTYLEAGIAVLVNAEYESMAEFITGNGFGIAVTSQEIGLVHKRVCEFDVAGAARRIRRYNETHSMEKEIARLVSSYERAIANRVGSAPQRTGIDG